MIEHIQKYKIIITLALVAVGAGFLIGGANLRRLGGSGAGGTPVLKIAGRTYDDREFQHLGTGSFELITSLARAGDFGLYQFLMGLSTGATSQKDAPEKFFIGRMILRQAKEELGVYPGNDEITTYIRGLRAFAGQDGKYDQGAFDDFIKKRIGRLGMTEGDLRDLVSDVIACKKITAILGSGLAVNRDVIAHNLALDKQQIDGAVGQLGIDPFETKIEPTDEQIKAYWETIQDAFNTEPRRKFSYFIASPEMPAETAATADTITDAAASDDAQKAATKKKEAAKAALAETQRQKQLELDTRMDDFFDELCVQKGATFDELIKNNKWELKTTELFARSSPPKELDLSLRSSSSGGKVVDALFRIEPTSDPLSKFSQPIAIGTNQWIFARLDGEEKSRPKTYAEAKDEARAQYIAEKAGEAMKTAATEAATKIKAALATGKSFADAAKDAGIQEVATVTKVTSSYQVNPAKEPKNLFEAARTIDPGTLAEVIFEADRAFIIYVAKREVVTEDKAAIRLDSEITARTNDNEMIIFSDWITTRTEAAKVEQLYKK